MLDRSHPLAALADASSQCGAVRLKALPPTGRLLIRGIAESIDMTLPGTCRTVMSGGNTMLWLGPDEFMLLASDGAVPACSVRPPASAVDVSHRDTALAVSGPRAAWVINAFCALDLHPSAFPVGMCTRTVFGKAEIVLWRIEPETFRIDVARSFAPYVWACLEEARHEFLD
jgi:heterotetrameric sarcosine oxidase gamma subunit